jgi:hypothetical protein
VLARPEVVCPLLLVTAVAPVVAPEVPATAPLVPALVASPTLPETPQADIKSNDTRLQSFPPVCIRRVCQRLPALAKASSDYCSGVIFRLS